MIIIFMSIPFSTQNSHILIANSPLNAAESFDVEELERVSGEDESGGNEPFILERFRALLGLKSLQSDLSFSPSPSPSPSPAAIAPSPVHVATHRVHIHEHSHPHQLRLHKRRPVYKPKREEEDAREGRVRKILVAVLVSAGVTILICSIIAFWVCKKFKTQREEATEKLSVKSETVEKSAKPNSPKSPKSGLDPFDLGMLGMDAEEEQTQCSVSEKEISVHKEREMGQEMLDSEFDNVSVSSTKEMMYVHEEDDSKSIQCVSAKADSSSGDRITPVKSCSSDDEESFHSCGDSNLSNARLSNASESSSANVITKSTCSVPTMNLPSKLETTQCDDSNKPSTSDQSHITLSPCNPESKMQMVSLSVGGQKNVPSLSPPPPPPPPPPPITDRSSFSLSSPFSTGSTSSSALLRSSSPAMSDSSSLSQIPWNDLTSPNPAAKPSLPSSSIPPPPSPPPSLKAKAYSFKTPPPLPSKLPQFMAFGKEGNSRPKLKPLHWDKVRAAPDRSMVWDKLRWSSFE